VSRVITPTRPPSAHALRATNAASVLDFGWQADAFTASDLIGSTGLSRSTALAVCDELIALGWLRELDDTRQAGTEYRQGRPARRYALRDDAGVVIGVDAGAHSITTIAADLRGQELARASRPLVPSRVSPQARIAAIEDTIDEVLAAAGPEGLAPLCIAVGVPAPVDAEGHSPRDRDPFWRRMNPDLIERLAHRGCAVIVDNDANLAALAEGAIGAGRGVPSFITVMTGERLGAGYVLDGRLVRGRGSAGELHLLNLVDGVGSPAGFAATLRVWARDWADSGGLPDGTALSRVAADEIHAENVLAAAAEGDEVATRLVDRLGDRVARIAAVLGGLLDVERIIFAGAAAASLTQVLEVAAGRLPEYMNGPSPDLVASAIGADMVALGAIARANEHVQSHALEIDLTTPA
jgi:predicted NBD/HSP70 family sugar kinase